MSPLGSLLVALAALVSASVLLALHDLDAAQYLAVLAAAGIHVSAVTIPSRSSVASPTATSAPASDAAPGAGA